MLLKKFIVIVYFFFHILLVSQTEPQKKEEEPNLISPSHATSALAIEALIFAGFFLTRKTK